MNYFFFILSGSAVICFEKSRKLISLTTVAITLIALAIMEFYRPGIIWPYATPEQRFMDVALCFILCLIINAGMTYIVFREFQRERNVRNSLLEKLSIEKEKVEKAAIKKHRLLSMVCHDSASALSLVVFSLIGNMLCNISQKVEQFEHFKIPRISGSKFLIASYRKCNALGITCTVKNIAFYETRVRDLLYPLRRTLRHCADACVRRNSNLVILTSDPLSLTRGDPCSKK